MQKQIKDLPFAFQSLFAELKAEKDAEEASATDYVCLLYTSPSPRD